MKGDVVWTLFISHRYGEDVTVFADEADAKASLAAYVDNYWGEDGPRRDGDDEPQPADPDEAIEAYFEFVESAWYSLDRQVVQ